VQDLRRYSGGQKEQASHFNLPTVIRKAVQWVIKASRIKPELSYELPERLEIKGCKGQIHQILVNLVQNALDAMGELEQPRLTIRCQAHNGQARIQVADAGPGIPEKDFAHIFDPFFTSKPVGQGTGLGLYISYGLARDLGGDLTAANQPGGGAVLTLTLPVHN
jgi:two-component system sensor histidine kinase HupT/HoxJ